MFDQYRPTILVVDHAVGNRSLIWLCLSPLPNLRTVAASDGAQAIRYFLELLPSLLLLDLAPRFGIASINPDANAMPQQLLQVADAGLAAAKRADRNQIGLSAR